MVSQLVVDTERIAHASLRPKHAPDRIGRSQPSRRGGSVWRVRLLSAVCAWCEYERGMP